MSLTPAQTRWLASTYEAHSERIFRTCLKLGLGDRDWARDRTHEVFLKLAEHIEAVENTEDPGGWLYRVAVRECYGVMRRRKTSARILGLLGLEDRVARAPDRDVQAQRDLSALAAALERLPPNQRAVMVLVHLEGCAQTEAAALLSLSKGQISKLHTRATAALAALDWEVTS